MYDRILIAVDGSDEAAYAAKRGLELAQRFGASVDVVHVVPQRTLSLARSTDERTHLRERGETAFAEVESHASDLDYPVTTALIEGTPAVRISEYAAEHEADCIVVAQGTTRLDKRLLGGVTEEILSRSDRPVFVVPHEPDDDNADYSRVLLPTDGTESAEKAVPHGIAVAQQYGSTLSVLHVVDLQAAGGLFSAGGLKQEFLDRLEANGQQAVGRVTVEVDAAAPELDVETTVERTTSFDGAAGGIRDYVERNEIDLIAMGSHGRSTIKRQLLGSVASAVLRTVDVPVLVVPRTA